MVKLYSLDRNHPGPIPVKGVVICQKCGFCHLDPLPDASTVARYYEDDQFYSQHSPPDWFKKEEWEHEQGYWQAYYDYLISFLRPWTPTVDIGAGAGWFVQRCPYALGVEPSTTARKFSPVSDDIVSNLDETGLGMLRSAKVNFVLALTLEHILDPESFLKEKIIPSLGPCRLIVVVPSEFNRLQRWIGGDWFVSPVHLNYFTRDSLRGLLERVGLKVVFEGATFPTEIWPLIGLDHRKNPEMGRRTHLWRLRLEKRFPGIFHLYGWLGRRWNIGREIIMVAERK